MKNIKIIKYINGHKFRVKDAIAEEVNLAIIIKQKELVSALCSPFHLRDFTVGYLYSSGIIKKYEGIKQIRINKKRSSAEVLLKDDKKIAELVFNRLLPPGCGKGAMVYISPNLKVKNNSKLKISHSKILDFMRNFQKRSEVYHKTGGIHSSAIADKNRILVFREDIGRHNAVDKVIGCMLRNRDTFKNKILLSSGRLSSEIILKAHQCLIPIIVSRSASTSRSVDLARKINITLIGFARGNRMNIYSGEERII